MRRPHYSVLLPTHNRADVIGFAIRSILQQTCPDFELLIVGDGCTDDTAAVVQTFEDSRIRWFDLPKAPGSGYRNRNIALREARGELIACMTHDDLLLPDHFQQLSGAFVDERIEWAYTRPLWVSRDGIIIPVCTNLTNDDELHYMKAVELFIPSSCVSYRRNCHDRYGMWPEHLNINGDREFWARILRDGSERNHAYLSVPTAFHFLAHWRTTESLETWPTTGNLLRMARERPWWPANLKMPVSPGVPEQATIFEAFTRGGTTWIAELRRALDRVISRVALDRLLLPPEAPPDPGPTQEKLAPASTQETAAPGPTQELSRSSSGLLGRMLRAAARRMLPRRARRVLRAAVRRG